VHLNYVQGDFSARSMVSCTSYEVGMRTARDAEKPAFPTTSSTGPSGRSRWSSMIAPLQMASVPTGSHLTNTTAANPSSWRNFRPGPRRGWPKFPRTPVAG
jgi:hypothetical protein